ncbi:Uncharacterised protein [uncultured archaeon]|nr:Uncharacterised protein [uncultured archaeon]
MAPKICFSGNTATIKSEGTSETLTKKAGIIYKLPDCTIAHITGKVEKKEIKEYQAEVIILPTKQAEQIITKLKPKLAILCGDKEAVYTARELQHKTGIQTIAAEDNLVVDLYAYSALAEQKSLGKFTTKE